MKFPPPAIMARLPGARVQGAEMGIGPRLRLLPPFTESG